MTLIELLIVIVIVAILSAVVLVAVGAFRDRGQSASCDSEVKTVETAVEAYKAKEGKYPDSLIDLTTAPGNYLRELPNTSENSGEYWITYNPSTGQVAGVLQDGTPCAVGELGEPLPSANAGQSPSGGSGGEEATTPAVNPSPSPTTVTVTVTNPTPSGSTSTSPTTLVSTSPSPTTSATTPSPPVPPAADDGECSSRGGSRTCRVEIDWPRESGDIPIYLWQNVRRSDDGSCDFRWPNYSLGLTLLSSRVTLRGLASGTWYCFRVRPLLDDDAWSPVLQYQTPP